MENLGASSQFSGAAMRHATGDERPLRAGHVEPQVAFTSGGFRSFAAFNRQACCSSGHRHLGCVGAESFAAPQQRKLELTLDRRMRLSYRTFSGPVAASLGTFSLMSVTLAVQLCFGTCTEFWGLVYGVVSPNGWGRDFTDERATEQKSEPISMTSAVPPT